MKAIMETDELKRLIKSTAKFVSKDQRRPMLEWIRLEFDKTSVKAIALNGYMAAIEKADLIDIDEPFIAYIKPYLPPLAGSPYAKIILDNGKLLIEAGDRIIGYEQPTGDFIDMDDTLKSLNKNAPTFKILFSKDLLEAAIRSVQQDTCTSKAITLKFSTPNSPMIIESENGVKYVLPCRSDGE